MENVFDIADSVRAGARVCTREEFERVLDSSVVKSICDQIKNLTPFEVDGEQQAVNSPTPSLGRAGEGLSMGTESYHAWKELIAPLKKQLPVLIPHAHFTDGKRHKESAEESPWMSMDFDGIENPVAFWKTWLEPKAEELRIVLAFVSPSKRGVKVVSQLSDGMTREEAQAWFAKEVGIEEYDHTHDLARCVYLVPRSYLLHYSPSLLFAKEVQPFEVKSEKRKVKSPSDCQLHSDALAPNEVEGERVATLSDVGKGASYDPTLCFGNLLYKDICEGFFEKKGYGKNPKVGNRHAALVAWVNAAFGFICDNDKNLMLSVTPRIKPEEEIIQIVENVEKYHLKRFSPYESRILKQVIAELQSEAEQNDADEDEALLEEEMLSELPPLPPPIKIMADICPPQYKVPMIICCVVMFGELLCRFRAKLNAYEVEFPGFFYVIEASAGGGKRFINIAKDLILKVAVENDKAQEDIYKRWEAEKQRHANDKNYVAPPEPKPIYMLGPNKLSPSEMLKEAQSNQGVGLLSICEEIDTHTNITKGGVSRDTSDLERIGYDGGEFTQRYAGQGTVYGSADLFLSYIFTGTPIATDRAFPDTAVENGLVSRYIFDYIDTAFKARPVFRELTKKEKKIVGDYAEKALRTCFDEEGNVQPIQMMNLSWALPQATQWDENYLKLAQATRNKALDAFRRRPLKMAIRAMIVANWLWGNKKSHRQDVIDFGLWLADHAIDSQMKRFGDYFKERTDEKKVQKEIQSVKACKSVALWHALPEVFKTKTVDEMKASFGLDSVSKKIISRLKEKGLIQKIDAESYRKVKSEERTINQTTKTTKSPNHGYHRSLLMEF